MSAVLRALFAFCFLLVPITDAADLFPGQLLIRTSTMAGTNVASEDREKLSAAVSTDGVNWRRLYKKSPLPNFSRDASVTRWNGEYLAVYTAAFNSTNAYFGLARSTNLVNWTASGVSLTGSAISNTPNNTWAPEWFVDNGRYYVLVRSSQKNTNFTYFINYAPPGIGYLECLDPGTWTNWTDFTPLSELEPTYENDPFLLKVGGTYHLFTDHFNYPGKPAILHRKSTAGPFSGFGPPVNIATNFANAPAYVASGLSPLSPWEGQFVLPLGGNRYRLYFQAMWFDASFCIDSNDGMQTWDINSMQRLNYDGLPADGHGSVISVVSSNLLVPIISAAKLGDNAVDDVQAAFSVYSDSLMTTNRLAGRADVLGSPSAYGLYTPASIVDFNLGGIVLQKIGSQVALHLQLQSTTNISSPFTNNGAPVSFPVDLSGDKHFLRVRALGPQ